MERKPIDIFEDFAKLINDIDSIWNNICEEVSRVDMEISDISHEIEFSEHISEQEAYQLVLDIKEARQRRRIAKNNQEIIRFIRDYTDNNKSLPISLFKVLKSMKKTDEHHRQKKYKPRIRTAPKSILEPLGAYEAEQEEAVVLKH